MRRLQPNRERDVDSFVDQHALGVGGSPMRVTPPTIAFRPLATSDLALLHNWLSRPHVVEWWPGSPTLADVAEEFGPAIVGIVFF
jgi:RimJ/RimL family protein N-acetyltransferase